MSIKIGQASLGETGGWNQKPGNQTGRELNISYWYNGHWLGLLRYKDPRKAERAAQTCEAAIKNRNIGYDMSDRNTAYEAARAVNWDVSKITKPVETDCSGLQTLCAVAAGCKGVEELYRKQGNSCTTYCMLHDWPTTGQFEMLSGKKFLTDDRWLRRGDILVSQGHTVMALDDGEMEDENMDKDRFAELFGQMRKDLQDNDCSQYSEEARQWATEKGIVLGGGTLEDGEPNYMWQDMMTREQFVTVLYRFAKLAGLA